MRSDEDRRNVASEQCKDKSIRLEYLNQPKQSLGEHQRDSPHEHSRPSGPIKYEEQRASQRSLNGSNARGRKLHQSQESHERSRFVSSASYRYREDSKDVKVAAYDTQTSVVVHDFAVDNIRTRSDLDGIAANSKEPKIASAISSVNEADHNTTMLLNSLCFQHMSRAPTFAHNTIAKSVANGNFVHHQDTFALVKTRQKHKHQSQSKIPPQAVVSNILQFMDYQTYLSMRLLSRS